MGKRVVITAVGVISSLGNNPDEILNSLQQDQVAFAASTVMPEQLVCPIRDFKLKAHTGRFKNSRYLNRGAQFTVAAAMDAAHQSGLQKQQWQEAGIFLGGGPNLDIEGELAATFEDHHNWQQVPALWLLRFLPNTAASVISHMLGVHGENLSLGTACAASLQAIGEAYRKIKDGYLSTALAGGGDSRLSFGALQGYKKAQALFDSGIEGDKEYSPFSDRRSGFVPGEGGAVFVLEELEQAQQRQAPILAEICGYGASMDGYQMTAPHPEGLWGKQAVQTAIRENNLAAEDIEVISTHGTGTLLNDAMEMELIRSLFPAQRISILALKSWIGHLAAACGAVELALALTCMHSGYLPRIRHLQAGNSQDLKFQLQNQHQKFGTLLLQNFGFGGQNAALVIKQWKH